MALELNITPEIAPPEREAGIPETHAPEPSASVEYEPEEIPEAAGLEIASLEQPSAEPETPDALSKDIDRLLEHEFADRIAARAQDLKNLNDSRGLGELRSALVKAHAEGTVLVSHLRAMFGKGNFDFGEVRERIERWLRLIPSLDEAWYVQEAQNKARALEAMHTLHG